jgi:SAM-dependent methyltransferase
VSQASWPELSSEIDPFHDEPPARNGYADYQHAGGTLDEARYQALSTAFVADMAAGARPEQLRQQALELRVWGPALPDHRTERPVAPYVPSEAQMARIAGDFCPTGAAEAADRVLGPLALGLDVTRPGHRATLQAAFAHHAFALADGSGRPKGRGFDPGKSAFDQWLRRKPRPLSRQRHAVRAVYRAPFTAWILHRRVPGGWILVDLVGLNPSARPTEAVQISQIGCPIREARPGDTLLARVLQGPDGWHAFGAIAIPGGPSRQSVRTWMYLELMRGRLTQRSLTVDRLLRRRGHVLARRVCEWAFLAGDDDPYSLGPLYDLEYVHHDEDVDHYVDLAHSCAGDVLEFGCGTGRLLLAIAAAGHKAHGVDSSSTMLEQLQEKVAMQGAGIRGRVSWEPGDFQNFVPKRRYPLVLLPFNAIHHCRHRDEVLAMLSVVRSALAPGGLFALDGYLPDLALYDRHPHQRFEERIFDDPRTGKRLHSWEQGWWDTETAVHHVVYTYQHEDGREERAHLQFSMYTLEELHEIIQEAGFEILKEAQDFEGTPVQADSLKWVAILRDCR